MKVSNRIQADPSRCKMWAMHERLYDHLTVQSCQAEIDGMAVHGQRIPVLARPATDDPDFDYELIYGARRLYVARHLNFPLDLELRSLSDQEAAIALDIENRQRADVSPYERGLCYAGWLRAKFFNSQEEIAAALHISPALVSRMIKLSRLPSVIVSAFESPLDIRETWALDLQQGWQDPKRQRALSAGARSIANDSPRPSAARIYERLIAQATYAAKPREATHDEVIKDGAGRPLFRIRYQRRSLAIQMEAQHLSDDDVEALKMIVVAAVRNNRPTRRARLRRH